MLISAVSFCLLISGLFFAFRVHQLKKMHKTRYRLFFSFMSWSVLGTWLIWSLLLFNILNDLILFIAFQEFKRIPLPPGAVMLETQSAFGNLLSRSNNCDYFVGAQFISSLPLKTLENHYAKYRIHIFPSSYDQNIPTVYLWDDGSGETSQRDHFAHLFERGINESELPDKQRVYLVSVYIAAWPDARCN